MGYGILVGSYFGIYKALIRSYFWIQDIGRLFWDTGRLFWELVGSYFGIWDISRKLFWDTGY